MEFVSNSPVSGFQILFRTFTQFVSKSGHFCSAKQSSSKLANVASTGRSVKVYNVWKNKSSSHFHNAGATHSFT